MDFVRAMAFCSIKKVRAAAKSSLRVKSRVQSPRSNTGCKRSCSSVISMQNEIGDMHPSTWKGCGESFSMEKGTILYWPLAKRTLREFVETAFSHVDLDWKEFVKHDPR